MGTRSVFLWEPGFPVLSRRITRRVSSLIWVVLGERLAVAGGNCLQEGEGPVCRKRVLDGTKKFSAPTSRRLYVVVRSPPLCPRGGTKWRDN